MSNPIHIFRCYPLSAQDPLDVEAPTREDAERIAAERLACRRENVFARYVKTLAQRPEHELEAGLRNALRKHEQTMGVK